MHFISDLLNGQGSRSESNTFISIITLIDQPPWPIDACRPAQTMAKDNGSRYSFVLIERNLTLFDTTVMN